MIFNIDAANRERNTVYSTDMIKRCPLKNVKCGCNHDGICISRWPIAECNKVKANGPHPFNTKITANKSKKKGAK